MAKLSNKKSLTNEEIEATIDELSKKLEILRVRYEQYFIGVEKIAPAVMRMDVVRIMRDLEQINIKNTALKFKLRTLVQKFTSYSTYWNRTLREIEDGTYKRHVDKAKREAARMAQKSGQTGAPAPKTEAAANPAGRAAAKAVADEADEFLASLGLSASRQTAQQSPASAAARNPGLTADLGQGSLTGKETAQTAAPSLRNRRPVIVSASRAAAPTAQTQTPTHQTPAQTAAPQTPNRAIVPQAAAPQRPAPPPTPQTANRAIVPQTPRPGAGHAPAPPAIHRQPVPGHAPASAPKNTPASVPGRVPARSAVPARDGKPSGLPPLGRPSGLPPKNNN